MAVRTRVLRLRSSVVLSSSKPPNTFDTSTMEAVFCEVLYKLMRNDKRLNILYFLMKVQPSAIRFIWLK